jgi:hypothetical protein
LLRTYSCQHIPAFYSVIGGGIRFRFSNNPDSKLLVLNPRCFLIRIGWFHPQRCIGPLVLFSFGFTIPNRVIYRQFYFFSPLCTVPAKKIAPLAKFYATLSRLTAALYTAICPCFRCLSIHEGQAFHWKCVILSLWSPQLSVNHPNIVKNRHFSNFTKWSPVFQVQVLNICKFMKKHRLVPGM